MRFGKREIIICVVIVLLVGLGWYYRKSLKQWWMQQVEGFQNVLSCARPGGCLHPLPQYMITQNTKEQYLGLPDVTTISSFCDFGSQSSLNSLNHSLVGRAMGHVYYQKLRLTYDKKIPGSNDVSPQTLTIDHTGPTGTRS